MKHLRDSLYYKQKYLLEDLFIHYKVRLTRLLFILILFGKILFFFYVLRPHETQNKKLKFVGVCYLFAEF